MAKLNASSARRPSSETNTRRATWTCSTASAAPGDRTERLSHGCARPTQRTARNCDPLGCPEAATRDISAQRLGGPTVRDCLTAHGCAAHRPDLRELFRAGDM